MPKGPTTGSVAVPSASRCSCVSKEEGASLTIYLPEGETFSNFSTQMGRLVVIHTKAVVVIPRCTMFHLQKVLNKW